MNLEIIIKFAPLLMQGLLMTIKLWMGAGIISIVAGIIFGILRSRRVRINYFSALIDAITGILRGVPFYVQLLIVYFVLPDFFGFSISSYTAAIMSLGLCSAAYVSQMVRGGINAISDEQWESAFVLGLSTLQTVRFVIIPQAIYTIIPMLCGELDMVLKSTAVISTIGVLELTGAGKNILASEMQVGTIYCAIALLYLCISVFLNMTFGFIERGVRYDSR